MGETVGNELGYPPSTDLMSTKPSPSLPLATLEALAPEQVDEPTARTLVEAYAAAKDLYVRNLCLRLLYDKTYAFLGDFFHMAFRKERYLDMRVLALRGLAQFCGEPALAGMLAKINEILRKRAVTTPYNYQEYEVLLGKNALPYLVGRYRYACLAETLGIVRANYDAMPDAFKGHFTIGEDGKPINLRTPEESKRLLDEFWAKQGKV
jgi:hypothetical protein